MERDPGSDRRHRVAAQSGVAPAGRQQETRPSDRQDEEGAARAARRRPRAAEACDRRSRAAAGETQPDALRRQEREAPGCEGTEGREGAEDWARSAPATVAS